MHFLFAHARTSRHDAVDSATQAAGAAPVEAGHTGGLQDLSALEIMSVAGGNNDAQALPVTKW